MENLVFQQILKTQYNIFSGEALLLHVTNLLVDVVPPAAPCQTDDTFLEDKL